MSAIMDIPSVVSGVKKMSFVTDTRLLLLRNIFGKSGAAVTATVPDEHMGNREVYLHMIKQENLPVFIILLYFLYLQVNQFLN